MIGGIPKERWLRAFAEAIAIAIDKDYFSDILFFDLYPQAWGKEDEEIKCQNYVKEAFKEIFGVELDEIYE